MHMHAIENELDLEIWYKYEVKRNQPKNSRLKKVLELHELKVKIIY